jgi:uncharacterized membrane protein
MNQIAGLFVFYACFTMFLFNLCQKGGTRFYFASFLSSVGWSFLGTNVPWYTSTKIRDMINDFWENILGQNGEIGW